MGSEMCIRDRFTQTLTCVRLNNQNGEGVPIALIRSYENSVGQLNKYESEKERKKENIKSNSGEDQVGDPTNIG